MGLGVGMEEMEGGLLLSSLALPMVRASRDIEGLKESEAKFPDVTKHCLNSKFPVSAIYE